MADSKALTRTPTKQEEQFGRLAKILTGDAMKKQIAAALPKTITAERMTRIVLSTVQRNPKLLECEPKSFLSCVMACAALGLEPDGVLGQAYLVPFWSSKDNGLICTLITGYQGLMKLAEHSGEISGIIDAHPVRVGDEFSYRYGGDPMINHVPAERPHFIENGEWKWLDGWKPGGITHFYAVARLCRGGIAFVVMPTWEVDQIRDESEGYKYAIKNKRDNNPWITDYDRMGCKTAIRRLCKYLPASVEDNRLHRAVAIDERADRGIDQEIGSFVDLEALPDLAPMPVDAPSPTEAEEGRRMKLGGSRVTVDTSAVPSDKPTT